MVLLSSSLTQFVSSDDMGGLESEMQYSRRGGYFISKPKGFLLVLLASAVVAGVGVAVYLLGSCRNKIIEQAPEEYGIEYHGIKGTRLPKEVRPSYYRLKIHPFIEYPWTFNGTVWISISASEPVKRIVLNAKGFNISESDVRITTIKETPSLIALSQIMDETSVADVDADTTTAAVADAAADATIAPAPEVAADTEKPENVPLNTAAPIEEPSATQAGRSNDTMTTPEPAGVPPVVGTTTQISIAILSQERIEEEDQHVFHLNGYLEPNRNYILEIPFTGFLEETSIGFYKSKYLMDGKPNWFAATQFQPTFARLAFPCFDEPAFKAEFEISIARKMHMSVVSNMPLRESEPISTGWTWDHFQKSVPMSTYLISYMISEMSQVEVGSSAPLMHIWSRPVLKSLTPYASQIVPKILAKYTKYFGSNYSLPKLDLIGNPCETEGAMENWGMIVFKESSLLLNRDESEPEDKLEAVKSMAHELAHMWFGNLVTMEWWSDIWLNEGFSIFMQYVGADHVEPKWNFLDQCLLDINYVMDQDCLRSSHPIANDLDEASEINAMFNMVSYKKGSALIRMLNFTLSEPVFVQAIQSYINKWKFVTSNKEDLWSALTEMAANKSSLFLDGLSVTDIMETWTMQKGYPVVNVVVDYQTGSAELTQEHFTLELGSKDNSLLWDIPISYTTFETDNKWSAVPKSWMKKSRNVILDNVVVPGNNSSWVIFNDLKTGFYRVNYDNGTWYRIINLLNTAHTFLPVATRSQIIDDAFSLAAAGQLSYATAFAATSYLKKERHYIPWTTAMRSLRNIETNLKANIEYEVLQEYIIRIMSGTYDAVVAEPSSNDNVDYSLLKTDLTTWLCGLDHEACVKKAMDLFQQWMKTDKPTTNNPIIGAFKAAYYCTAVRRGGKTEWDFVWTRTMETPILAEKETLIEALACTNQPWLIVKLLEKTLTGEIEEQHARMVWTNLRSTMAVNVGFDFFRDNWMRIWEKFSKSRRTLRRTTFFLSKLSTETKYQELSDFKSKHRNSLKSISNSMSSISEMIQLRIDWKKKYITDIAKWLNGTKT